MSPCYAQDCVAIHFTWKRNWPAVEPLLRAIETALAPFAAAAALGKAVHDGGAEFILRLPAIAALSRAHAVSRPAR